MATLENVTIASSYTSLLKLDGNTDSPVAASAGNAVQIKTGDNDATPLYLNTDRVGIGIATPGNFTIATSVNPGASGVGLEVYNGDLFLRNVDTTSGAWSNLRPGITIATHTTTDDEYGGALYFASTDASFTTTNPKRVAGISWQATETFAADNDSGAKLCFFTTPENGGTAPTMTERMVIDEDGNVGVGTGDPVQGLEISHTDNTEFVVRCTAETVDKTIGIRMMTGANGTALASTNSVGGLLAKITQAHASTLKGQLEFYANSGDSFGDSGGDPQMIMTPTGRIGLNCLVPAQMLQLGLNTAAATWIRIAAADSQEKGIEFANNTTMKWQLNNNAANRMVLYDGGDTSIAMHVVTTGTTWVVDSDERIKENVENIVSVLDSINELRPITYQRKYAKSDIAHPGLIAQEVLPKFPLLVSGNEDDFKEITKDGKLTYEGGLSIGYSNFVPYLIKAIQELSAKVTALENA
jgi:hypothetical protein